MKPRDGFASAPGRAGLASAKPPKPAINGTAINDQAAQWLWAAWQQKRQEAGADFLSAAALSAALPPRRASAASSPAAFPARWPAEAGWSLLGRFLSDFFLRAGQKPLPMGDAPSNARIEYRPLPSAAGARCALLTSGGLRIYAPEPTGADTLSLLAHEYGHALLALAAPGSLSNHFQTESHALALERCLGRWLSRQTAERLGAEPEGLRRDLRHWWRQRRSLWTVRHQRLAVFEAALARTCLSGLPAPSPLDLNDWWRRAHDNPVGAPRLIDGAVEPPGGWAGCAALFGAPGRFHQSALIWRQSIRLARNPAPLRAALFQPAVVSRVAPRKHPASAVWSRPLLAFPTKTNARLQAVCDRDSTPLNGENDD